MSGFFVWPEASFTTKVCMEKITLSSRRPFFSSP